MKRWLIVVLLFVPVAFLVDLGISVLQAYLFRMRIGQYDILPALCEKVRPGMSLQEVERQLDGFRDSRIEPNEGGFLKSYIYWFGIIPPFGGDLSFKLLGEVQVAFSSDQSAEKCSFWYN